MDREFYRVRKRISDWLDARRDDFSLAKLAHQHPALASLFLWKANALPDTLPEPLWLHLGCGENVLDGFLNLDFIPHDARVAPWDFLQPWPARWPLAARGAFSEDTLEHFYLAEQLYILCEVNRALSPGGVFRVLMPALDRLLAYCRGFRPRAGEFLHQTFAVETEADAVNAGMRFSGHRWLHDDASLAHLAAEAGFEAVKTSCATSTEPYLCGRNLRVEEGTAAFAHDLRKVAALRRVDLAPAALEGLEKVEAVAPGIDLARVRSPDARLRFVLPEPLQVAAIACVNVRSASLGSFREHNAKRLVLNGDFGEGVWTFDETLKSDATVNIATGAALGIAAGGDDRRIEEIALVPGAAGDLVTTGALELFVRERAWLTSREASARAREEGR